MSWYINEIVNSGNSSARVKSYNSLTKFIVLMDVVGDIKKGSIIIGSESGTIGTLNEFVISNEYEEDQYADTSWDEIDYFIHNGNGELVALDKHFNGKESQDYQTTYLVKIDGS